MFYFEFWQLENFSGKRLLRARGFFLSFLFEVDLFEVRCIYILKKKLGHGEREGGRGKYIWGQLVRNLFYFLFFGGGTGVS